MKYVFKEECKTILVAALGHAKIDFTLQSKVNVTFGMAKRCQ